MNWSLVFCVIALCSSQTHGQRRALVHYSLTSPEEVEPFSENPLSSSINSIQTGREELIALHRADTELGGSSRRGYHKTTTPDYFKEPVVKNDSTNTGKTHSDSLTKSSGADTKMPGNGSRNHNSDKVEETGTYEVPTHDRRDGGSSLFKDKRSSGFESPPQITVRPDKRNHSEAERSFQKKDEVKASMDINRGTPLREQDRRSNTHESRRHTTTPSSSSGVGFNISAKEASERHRDELSEKNHNERLNRERRPVASAESARGHRTTPRTASDKGQILTHSSTQRIPTAHRYDRAEQPAMSAGSHDKKAPDRTLDSRDSFKNVDERLKVSDGESGPADKTFPTENGGEAKIRGVQTNSSIHNKPTHLLIGEERPRSPDVYRDEFRGGGVQDDSIGKVGSDTDKSSGGGEGKTYAARPYGRDDDDGRPPNHQSKDRDTDHTRGQRDRYDERSYEERPLKVSQTRRDRERNATYYSQDSSASRSSRPRDSSYDEEYRDDEYKRRDAMQDGDDISKGQTRMGGRPYTKIDDDVDRDRYADDGTRNYRDYSDDRRYRDEHVPTDRDSSRRYRGEENRRYRDDRRRTYDDYEGKDRYDSRYGTDGLYSENVTRSSPGSGPRQYEGEEGRRSRTEYDRLSRRYKDNQFIYNNTERYRDYYDGYRDDNRSSGESGSSSRYDEGDGARSSRYDDEEYKDRRSYSARDSDQKYVRRDNEGTSRQRDPPRYRKDYEDSTYRDETSVYNESSSTDRYNQEKRRTFEEEDDPGYGGTRLGTNVGRNYDHINSDSRRQRGDGSYRSTYDEDVYYNNRTATGSTDRYGESDRPRRRTDDDSLGYETSDNRKYTPRSSDERRRDRDRDYEDNPLSRRVTDSDDTRKDTSRIHDEDHYRGRGDSYDERTYRSQDRDDDEYIRSSRDRVKDYDLRSYRDSDDDLDTRNYRVRGDDDVNDRYRGDDIVRDQVSDDELKNTRPVSGRDRDKDYIDRRYEEGYRDKSSEATYRYREEDEKHRYAPSEDRKVEHRDPERRNRGTQRFHDHYEPSGRDSNIPRNADDRRRGIDRSNRREDRYISDHGDFNDKAPDRPSTKVDTARRGDTKSEFPTLRDEDSLLRERSNPYSDEHRRDGTRSQTRDIQQGVRTSGTQYTSHSDDLPPKPRVSEDHPDTFDKGDFARGRRTSFYSEDDKADPDRDALAKGSRDDRRFTRTGKNEEVTYTQNEKGRGSTYDTRDLIPRDRSDPRPNTGQSQIYSNRRDSAVTSRHKTKDEIPTSRITSDLLPTSEDAEYFEKTEDAAKRPISHSNDETQRRRYPSSSYDRGGRRRLPNLREPEIDRPTRRDESEYKPEDPVLLPENRGRYRYTKSRGDREDFSRHADEGSLAAGDEYVSSGAGFKDSDANRRDTLKGEYGSPGAGTPTRNKEDRIPSETGHQDKEEYYHSSREKVPPTNGKPVDDIPAHREFVGHEKVPRDRDNIGQHRDRGVYENDEHPRSSPKDETKFRGENTTSDRFESPNRDVHVNKENVPFSLVVSQTVPSTRVQGSSISRSATPIPHYQDKEFTSRNMSSKINSDRIIGSTVNREKRFQYDDRLSSNNTARSVTTDELSKRPLSTKEVIDAAYRHSDEPKEAREVFYPVYVPGSSNMTSPDVIRPSERRGITTPTKKKKKK